MSIPRVPTMSIYAAELAGRTEARRPGRWLWSVFGWRAGTSRDDATAHRACQRAARAAVRYAGGGNEPATAVLPCARVVRSVPVAHAAYLAAGGDTDRRILDED
jgi:hypothetical protein